MPSIPQTPFSTHKQCLLKAPRSRKNVQFKLTLPSLPYPTFQKRKKSQTPQIQSQSHSTTTLEIALPCLSVSRRVWPCKRDRHRERERVVIAEWRCRVERARIFPKKLHEQQDQNIIMARQNFPFALWVFAI